MPDDEQAPRLPYPQAAYGRRAAVPPALLQDSRQRPMAEYLMPAAVILAGVLLVVAFGFVISGAIKDDAPTAIPTPPPPALGEIPPPSDQGLIPIPSASPSKSPSAAPPRTTPPTGKPTTKPPASATTPPPPPPRALKVDRAAVPGRVDLSGEGSRDWVHWGQEGTFSLERAKDGDFQILEGAPTAPRFRHTNSQQRFAWRDGSPVADSDGSNVGINTCDKGNGFTLSVPAAKDSRTLRLYVGVQNGRGRLEAKLSSGGGTEVGTLEQRDGGLATAVFVITYRSDDAGKLNLTWTTAETFGDGCGGVALQAATLR